MHSYDSISNIVYIYIFLFQRFISYNFELYNVISIIYLFFYNKKKTLNQNSEKSKSLNIYKKKFIVYQQVMLFSIT